MLNPFIPDCLCLTLLLLRLLEHLLDHLLLLNQESTDNAVLNAVGAARSSVSALNGLLGAGNGGVLAGAESWNTSKLGTAVLSDVNSRSSALFVSDLHRTWGQCPSS